MKKLVSLAVLSALTVSVADAAPSYLQRGQDGSYKVTYDYTDRAEAGWWYMGGRLDLNLLSWKNDYDTAAPNKDELRDDSFTELLFGGNVFVGHTFDYFWRAEVEAGIISEFEDEEGGTTFKLTTPYLMANGYYDFANGFYVGAGLGIAVPKTRLQGVRFTGGDNTERNVSPMIGLMGGWSYHLDYNLLLDIRYRLATFWGPEQERRFIYKDDMLEYDISNDIGMIWDNSVSIGLRYEF